MDEMPPPISSAMSPVFTRPISDSSHRFSLTDSSKNAMVGIMDDRGDTDRTTSSYWHSGHPSISIDSRPDFSLRKTRSIATDDGVNFSRDTSHGSNLTNVSIDLAQVYDEPEREQKVGPPSLLGIIGTQKPDLKHPPSTPVFGADAKRHSDIIMNPFDQVASQQKQAAERIVRPHSQPTPERLPPKPKMTKKSSLQVVGATDENRPRSQTRDEYKCDVVFIVSQPLVFRATGPTGGKAIPALNYDKEEEALIRACKLSHKDVRYARRTASVSCLRRILTTRARVLHYCGHGMPVSLVFEDDEDIGYSKIITADVLETLVQAGSANGLQLVIVSACHSEAAGTAFVRAGAPHVVAVKRNFELNDSVTKTFTEHFYTGILANHTVAEAFEIAVSTVYASFKHDATRQFEHDKFVLLPQDADHNVHVFNDLLPGEFEEIRVKSMKTYTRPLNPEQCVVRHELQLEVMKAIQHNRLTVLTGNTGIGKSHLAHVVCEYFWEREEFGDGIFDVDCSTLTTTKDLLRHVANHLKEVDFGISDETFNSAMELSKQLGNSRCLIVLDNLHCVDERQPNFASIMRRLNGFIDQVLQKTDEVRLLVTLRSPHLVPMLTYAQKQPIKIPPLEESQAGQLFVRSSPKLVRYDRNENTHLVVHPVIKACEGIAALVVYASTLYFNYDTIDDEDMLVKLGDRKDEMKAQSRNVSQQQSALWHPSSPTAPINILRMSGDNPNMYEVKREDSNHSNSSFQTTSPTSSVKRLSVADAFAMPEHQRRAQVGNKTLASIGKESKKKRSSSNARKDRRGGGSRRSQRDDREERAPRSKKSTTFEDELNHELGEFGQATVDMWRQTVGEDQRQVHKRFVTRMLKSYYEYTVGPDRAAIRPIGSTERSFLSKDIWSNPLLSDYKDSDSVSLRAFACALRFLDGICTAVCSPQLEDVFFNPNLTLIAGMYGKRECMRLMREQPEGTYMFRFSTSVPRTLVIVVKRERSCEQYQLKVAERSERMAFCTSNGGIFDCLQDWVAGVNNCQKLWTPQGVVPTSVAFADN